VKLIKFKFQGPPFAQAPSKALGGALVMRSRGHTLIKNAKVRYLNHYRLSITEVCRQLIDKNIILFFWIL
jgi:hypothetical protein